MHEPHCAILESAMEMVIREARTVPHTCCIAKSRTSDSGPHSLPRTIVSCAQLSFSFTLRPVAGEPVTGVDGEERADRAVS